MSRGVRVCFVCSLQPIGWAFSGIIWPLSRFGLKLSGSWKLEAVRHGRREKVSEAIAGVIVRIEATATRTVSIKS